MIRVTKTYLPDIKRYNQYLKRIWTDNWVTNNGQLVQKLEKQLAKYLGVKHLFLVTNGTLALQIAIRAMDLKGEIITTPFSYVATTSSIVWENCKPVFADINPDSLCINPDNIESLISKYTSAILPVHVYGNVCEVEKIKKIADKHNLKIIYDSAHSFGVKYKGKSVLRHGDINILSFHATKIFHTAEGGAVATNNSRLAKKIIHLRNFGHEGEENISSIGINGKMSELHAAMGLSVLPEVKRLLKKRKEIAMLYDKLLSKTNLNTIQWSIDATKNYGYYPVIFSSQKQMLKIKNFLNQNEVFPRRYFYPPLNRLSYIPYRECPIAEDISERILCLPLFPQMQNQEVELIAKLIIEKL